MTVNRFRAIALVLRPYVSDTYTLIEAADAVINQVDGFPAPPMPTITSPDGLATYNWETSRWDYQHDALVNIALANQMVLGALDAGRKIDAIKNLRTRTSCGLKAAKEAVEDHRVVAAAEDRYRDPWSDGHPPF